MTDTRFAGVLESLTRDYRLYFPERTTSPEVRSVKLLPRRLSDIARAELAFEGATTTLYIKMHKKPGSPPERVRAKARLEFDTLRDLHDKFRAESGYSVVRPIAFFADDVAVVTEAGKGENLYALIKRDAVLWHGRGDAERLASHCRAAGAWLRRFQDLTRRPGLGPLPAADMRRRLEADLRACVAIGLSPAVADEVDGFIRGTLQALERRTYPVVGVHPDFQPDNVLLSADGITVLDFTSFHHGTPHSDVARFLCSLVFFSKSPAYAESRMQGLMRAFLGGYGRSVEELNPALTAYVLCFVLTAAASVGSWRRPWPLKPLMQHQTVRHLTRWCRTIIRQGEFRLVD
jgi:Ser/Thr protein kinase RdoA (MazF antagonist)